MLKVVEFWIVSALGALVVALVAANIYLVHSNRGLQADGNARAQFIQQTVQLQGLYQDIIKGVADLSLRNHDDALRDVLTQEGITVSVNAPTDGAAAAGGARSKP
jgi:hypothetical protein